MKVKGQTKLIFLAAALVFLGVPAGHAEESAIRNFQDKAAATWDKLAAEIDVDRPTYVRIAGEELDKVSSSLRDLKTKNPEKVSDKEWQDILNDLEQKKGKSEDQYRNLKSSDEQNWKKVKSDLDKSLEDTKKSIGKSADRALSEKEAYEIKAQDKIDQLDLKIQKLEVKAAEVQGGEKQKLQDQINQFKTNKDEAQKHLDDLKKDNSETWKNHKDALEACLRR